MEQIMNQTDVKVSFYLKKSEADAKGNCPVMARLIVGKYSETAFSVKLRVPQSLWLSGRACGKSAAARDINNRLDEIRAAAFSIYAEQSANREVVTAEEVKHQLLGMASEQETLLSYFRLFMRNFEKRVGINRTESSLNGYRNSYDHLVRFLQSQYKLSDIPFAALDRSFIEKFDLHLRTECHLAPGTIVNLTVRLKTIVGEAIADGIITRLLCSTFSHQELTDADICDLSVSPLTLGILATSMFGTFSSAKRSFISFQLLLFVIALTSR